MKSMTNSSHIEGLIHNHDLTEKVSGPNSKNPGTKFISGTIEIATDNDCINIVPVHYTYVTQTTAGGKDNPTYNTLANVINGTFKTIASDGRDKATRIRIDSAIGLNEFYSDRNGTEELVSVKRNEGGFAHTNGNFTEDETLRNTFDVDIVITGTKHVDADSDKGLDEKVIIKGAIFSFRKELLPVEFSVVNPTAMNYFESLDASNRNPVFTRIRGRQVSETITRQITEEGAFGEPSVREVKSSRKDFVVTWAKATPYDWDDESTITVEEFKKAIADREMTLATLKQRNADYKASKNSSGNSFVAAKPSVGTFDF